MNGGSAQTRQVSSSTTHRITDAPSRLSLSKFPPRDLRDILRAVSLMRYKGEKIVELVSGHGEIWSARMLTALFQQCGHDFFFIDARKVRGCDLELGVYKAAR